MIAVDKATEQMTAAFRMALDAPGWKEELDQSVDGVFRSFWAFVFTAPFSFLAFYSLRKAVEIDPSLAEIASAPGPFPAAVAAHFVSLAMEWGLSIAALVAIARSVGATTQAAALITGFNWIQPMVTGAFALSLAPRGFEGGGAIADILSLPAAILAFALLWGVLRRGLGMGVMATIAMLGMLIVIGLAAGALAGGVFALFYSSP